MGDESSLDSVLDLEVYRAERAGISIARMLRASGQRNYVLKRPEEVDRRPLARIYEPDFTKVTQVPEGGYDTEVLEFLGLALTARQYSVVHNDLLAAIVLYELQCLDARNPGRGLLRVSIINHELKRHFSLRYPQYFLYASISSLVDAGFANYETLGRPKSNGKPDGRTTRIKLNDEFSVRTINGGRLNRLLIGYVSNLVGEQLS